MPLSAPAPREPLHERRVTCRGYRRADGLYDIEGHLVDVKSYDFANHDRGGTIRAGEPLHEMWVSLTVDEDFLIQAVEVVTDHGPFSICGTIAPAFSRLTGERVGPGFLGKVKQMFSGVQGCTHIVELFAPIATTVFQTLYPVRETRESGDPGRHRPAVIGTCHALAADGPVVQRQWPQFYEGE